MRSDTAGFTMVEVIVALMILTIGILGLAGTTAVVVRQVTTSKIATERAAAVQSALEELQSMGYDSIPPTGSETFGGYSISWEAAPLGRTMLVSLVTTGPGLQRSAGNLSTLSGSVTDTFTYKVIRP